MSVHNFAMASPVPGIPFLNGLIPDAGHPGHEETNASKQRRTATYSFGGDFAVSLFAPINELDHNYGRNTGTISDLIVTSES